MDTPKTEEKTTTVNAEGNKSEAPKKKKNIIRVFHAQNASDGGKGRRKPAAGEKKGTPPAGYRFAQARKSPGACILAGAGACMEGVKASYFMVTVPSAILYTPGQLTRLPQETVRRAVASTVTLLGA